MQTFTPMGNDHDPSQCPMLSSETNDCLQYCGYPPPTTCNRLYGDILLNSVNPNIRSNYFNYYDPLQNFPSVSRGHGNSGTTNYANDEAQCSFPYSEEHYATTPCAKGNNQKIDFANSPFMSHSLGLFSHGARTPKKDSSRRSTSSIHIGDLGQVCSAEKGDE